MAKIVESYNLGNIRVTVTETDKENKFLVECFDGEYKSDFIVSSYELAHYRRLMNQKITEAFKTQRRAKNQE